MFFSLKTMQRVQRATCVTTVRYTGNYQVRYHALAAATFSNLINQISRTACLQLLQLGQSAFTIRPVSDAGFNNSDFLH